MSTLRPARRAGWIWAGLAAGIALNSWRLRRRLQGLTVLDPVGDPDAADEGRDEFVVLRGTGVTVDTATRASAVAFARRTGARVVDLVPGDLAVDDCLDLARLIDAGTYTADPLALGRGPLQATLVRADLLARAELDGQLIDGTTLDAPEYLDVIATLKKFAPSSTHVVIAPGLRAAAPDPRRRATLLRTLYGPVHPIALGVAAVEPPLILAGSLVAPGWAAAAAAVHLAQPWLITAGSPIRPRDRDPASVLARPLTRFAALRRTGASASELQAAADHDLEVARDAARADYDELLADGIDRFFEPRRTDCPLCGHEGLTEVVRTHDRLQGKPGTFVLDRCDACAHIFQNPRLSLEGLDFYYRDFYDGFGEAGTDVLFAMGRASYQGRVDMVRDNVTRDPARWLDVGTGHGHFCMFAAPHFPTTVFDGLDIGPSVDEAEKRGWVHHGIQGLFPEAGIADTYDVLSMHHYLEHTREPVDELRAARTALVPGGLLMIEVPDPECRFGAAFGPLWGPWFQPQHQHFVSADNLTALLEREGFDIVTVDRTTPHQPVDTAFALMLLTEQLAPLDDRPWLEPATPGARALRSTVYGLAAPGIAAGMAVDHLAAPVVRRRPGGSNTYRLLARKRA